MGEIGSIPIPSLHVLQQTKIVFALHIGHIQGNGEELLHEVHDLLIGQPDSGQGINATAQLAHVLLSQSQGFLGLMDTKHDILGVLGRPDTLCAVKGQIKGVLTHNPDGGHGNLDTTAAVVGVHHHQIGSDLVPGDDIAVGHTGQHPDLAATLQGPGSLVGHTSTQQIIGELESILVLHHLVAVGHDTKGFVVGAAEIDLVAGDQGAVLGVDILLDDLPIQASVDQGISGGGSLLDFRTQAMPGLFTDVEHGFNISGHNRTSKDRFDLVGCTQPMPDREIESLPHGKPSTPSMCQGHR